MNSCDRYAIWEKQYQAKLTKQFIETYLTDKHNIVNYEDNQLLDLRSDDKIQQSLYKLRVFYRVYSANEIVRIRIKNNILSVEGLEWWIESTPPQQLEQLYQKIESEHIYTAQNSTTTAGPMNSQTILESSKQLLKHPMRLACENLMSTLSTLLQKLFRNT